LTCFGSATVSVMGGTLGWLVRNTQQGTDATSVERFSRAG
jgi:hypothetical protein